ncbi:MAG: hypothetical protein WD716_03165 [Fimbriimonadaceae bacterium]
MPAKPVVLTFATGSPKYATMAKALALTLEMNYFEGTKAIITDIADPEIPKLFDVVLPPQPGYKHWFTKLCALEATEFDRVLFIDADSLVVRPIDRVFEQMRGSDFAVQGRWAAVQSWYGDMGAVIKKRGLERIPVFSGGFLYYERTESAKAVIGRSMELAASYDELGLHRNSGHVVDEVCISIAMAETGFGRVFPDSSQFSMTPWGRQNSIKLDVLRGECSFIKGSKAPRLVKPLIYHTAQADADPLYWREVRRVFKVNAHRLGRRATPVDLSISTRKVRRLLTMLRGRPR